MQGAPETGWREREREKKKEREREYSLYFFSSVLSLSLLSQLRFLLETLLNPALKTGASDPHSLYTHTHTHTLHTHTVSLDMTSWEGVRDWYNEAQEKTTHTHTHTHTPQLYPQTQEAMMSILTSPWVTTYKPWQ